MIFVDFIKKSWVENSRPVVITIEENKLSDIHYIICCEKKDSPKYLLIQITFDKYARYLLEDSDTISEEQKRNAIIRTAEKIQYIYFGLTDVFNFGAPKHSLDEVSRIRKQYGIDDESADDYEEIKDYTILKLSKHRNSDKYMISLFGRPYCFLNDENAAKRIFQIIGNDCQQIIEARWKFQTCSLSDKYYIFN